ncbi:ATP-dependent 3'-5' DNA helicase Ecym_2790 [Eremothecium cymbalariae DBVPG|uniref:DNA 3'-5' helicase n=1 Tax=Eremothecium cymbalariae (strain CBS 270.75 / DBVPG 7215 / KCTC 17166 / NRRL Y-17582) TaxID=931890 RepID=G8JQ25_ERECY|nr:Hypothetical protein Ecym_2790 [Eremothecium cymbalariae DBVPG\
MSTPTQSQQRVISYPYQPNSTLKVVAGPGSGKTFTLLNRVYDLIRHDTVKPDEILILSLTNKAVDNIVLKISETFRKLNSDGHWTDEELVAIIDQLGIHTFHSLANKIVSERVGLVSVIEDNGWRGLMKLLPNDFWKTRKLSLTRTPKVFARFIREYQIGNIRKEGDPIAEKLLTFMKGSNIITNDDLLLLASSNLDTAMEENCTGFTNDVLYKFKVIFVDEYQDLFPVLAPLLKKIALNKQLVMFGDEDQSIYGFLGNNSIVMKELASIRSKNKSVVLNLFDNFRCTPEITKTANKLTNNPKKSLIEDSKELKRFIKPPSNVLPCVLNTIDTIEELEFLTDQICLLVSSSVKLSDIAILTRTNIQMSEIATHLSSYGIPIEKLTSQPDWMSDVRLGFLIDLLKVATLVREEALLPEDSGVQSTKKSDFSVILTLSALKGIGDSTIQSLYDAANKQGLSLWNYITNSLRYNWKHGLSSKNKVEAYVDTIEPLIDNIALQKLDAPKELINNLIEVGIKLEIQMLQPSANQDLEELNSNLVEFYKVVKSCSLNKPSEVSLAEWILKTYSEQTLAVHRRLFTNPENNTSQCIRLSTIHSSKGLEFPIVFLMGRSQLNFPIDNNSLYVGMTRCRNLLYLVNVNHPKIKNLPNKSPYDTLRNKDFWAYYNRDLNRPYKVTNHDGLQIYNQLRKKYNLRSNHTRSYSSISRFFVTFTRNIIK